MQVVNRTSESPRSEERKPGIFYGYMIVLCSFLIMMIMWGAQYCFGIFFKPMLNELGLSRGVLSGAYSINTIIQGIVGIFTGKLSDKYGPRIVVTVCGSCLGISYLLMSRVEMVWQIYVIFGVLASLGMAGCWVPLLSTITRWFVFRRGFMCGFAAAGIGVGLMILPPVAGYLITSFGWRTSYIIVGLTVLVVVITTAQLLKRDPSEIGLSALGVSAQHADGEVAGYTLKEALRTRQFWMLSAAFVMMSFCVHALLVHIVPYATDAGIAAVTAATIISVIGGVSIISKVGAGVAIDRLGNKRVAIMAATLMFLSMIIIQLSNSLEVLYVFAVIFAFAYGGFIAMQSPYVAELFGLKHHGIIFGFSIFIMGSGSALGPFVAGRIFDATSSYHPTFVMLSILSFLAVLLVLGIKQMK